MEMYLQDLNVTIPRIQKHFTKYPSASISAMFRSLRKSPNMSFFGDYPIVSTIVTTMQSMGIPVKKSSLKRACRQSEELKGQKLLLNHLLNNKIAIRNSARKPYNRQNYARSTNQSSRKEKSHG